MIKKVAAEAFVTVAPALVASAAASTAAILPFHPSSLAALAAYSFLLASTATESMVAVVAFPYPCQVDHPEAFPFVMGPTEAFP